MTTEGTNCPQWVKQFCDIDAGADGPTSSCAGDCVPPPPAGWSGPYLLWTGAPDSVPPCPSNAPVTAYTGKTALLVPDAGCTACTCSIAGGACSLPEHLAAGSGTCEDAGAVTVAFDPPSGWDGGCTSGDALDAGTLCAGGACLASIIAGPLVVTPPSCTPSIATLADAGAPAFTESALACENGAPFPPACNGMVCAPRAADAPGVLSCIFQPGINDCPAPYAKQVVVAMGFEDRRGCAPCACGASGSSCAATLSIFSDDACTSKDPLALALTGAGPACADLPDAGAPLGSKRIDSLVLDAGACAPSGGEPTDSGVTLTDAATFCCLATA
jgi:hypothetical protein